jgi:antitoxin component YwqK of YwqJK toxin-antitoxin module
VEDNFFWWVVVSNEFVCIFELLNPIKMNNELTPYIEYYDIWNRNVRVKGQLNSKGQREGLWEWFYLNGNIRMRTSYKRGKIDGIEEEFDEEGNIFKTYVWKEGILIEETKH